MSAWSNFSCVLYSYTIIWLKICFVPITPSFLFHLTHPHCSQGNWRGTVLTWSSLKGGNCRHPPYPPCEWSLWYLRWCCLTQIPACLRTSLTHKGQKRAGKGLSIFPYISQDRCSKSPPNRKISFSFTSLNTNPVVLGKYSQCITYECVSCLNLTAV